MSKRICGRCKSTNVVEDVYCGGTAYYRCDTCHHLGEKDEFQEMTLFDRITVSPEVLAEKLVYRTGTSNSVGLKMFCYKSTIVSGFWEEKAEAIAATVARLTEVDNGRR